MEYHSDLDSIASSIAYSFLASNLLGKYTVPLIRTPRSDLYLRAENLYALELAKLKPDQSDLLCFDDIPPESYKTLTSSSFVLLDHNRIHPEFLQGGVPPKVVGIIDHHEDEGSHIDVVPRVVKVPVGSCASLVALHFQPNWEKAPESPPPELASLLLLSIFIDTQGLKPGGKAEQIDRDAANFLFPRSTFASMATNTLAYGDSKEIKSIINTLQERKGYISHLSSRDLLRRDYKEYTFESKSQNPKRVTVGIATVPLNPKDWREKDPSPRFWESMDSWMDERKLDMLGVLCTFTGRKSGKHKRSGMWLVRNRHSTLKDHLWKGMEADEELKLHRTKLDKKGFSKGLELNEDGDIKTRHSVARVWKQGNPKATRKTVAPLVKALIEGA